MCIRTVDTGFPAQRGVTSLLLPLLKVLDADSACIYWEAFPAKEGQLSNLTSLEVITRDNLGKSQTQSVA